MHPRLSVDQLCFPGASIGEFVGQCRTLGVHDVVLTSPGLLAEGGPEAAVEALRDGPRVEAVNHPFAIHPDLERDDGQAGENLARVIDIASRLGARSVYVVTGGRGGLTWEAAAERFAELVAPGAALAADRGLRLMIENSNGLYADIHIAHTLDDTVSLARSAGLGVCVELQFCWVERGLESSLRDAISEIGLVQVSDYVLGDRSVPGRAVPGDGVLPLERLVGLILELGYEGMFDIELLGPRIDAEGSTSSVTRAATKMDEILTTLGA